MKTILIILAVALCSCSSVKKLNTSTTKKVDSSLVQNSHVQMNTKQDSTALKISGENHEIKLQIEFDSMQTYSFGGENPPYNQGSNNTSIGFGGGGIHHGDYFDDEYRRIKPNLNTIKIAGKEISSSQRMKLLTVMVSGETSVFDLTKNVKSDSSLYDSNKAVTVKKVEVVKSRSVQRKGMKILIALGIALIIGVGIYIYITRKKKI